MAIFNSRHRLHVARHQGLRVIYERYGGVAHAGVVQPGIRGNRGSARPAIQAKLLDGTAFNLADEAGKVVIVNMWATWCAPCREEMPALDAYYRQHRDQGLVLVALSMDDPKDEAKVRDVTRAYSFPVGLRARHLLERLRAHLAPSPDLRGGP